MLSAQSCLSSLSILSISGLLIVGCGGSEEALLPHEDGGADRGSGTLDDGLSEADDTTTEMERGTLELSTTLCEECWQIRKRC